MVELILSTMIVAGKVEVAPNIFEYDLISCNNTYHRLIANETEKIIEFIQ